MRHALALSASPRALCGPVQANGPANVTALHAAFNDFRQRNDNRIETIEAAINDLGTSAAALLMNGGGQVLPVDREYTDLVAAYVRRGVGEEELRTANATGRRGQISAAMSVGSDTSGGYTAPVEWDRTINAALQPLSPMRRLATVRQTNVGGYSTLWKGDNFGTGWVGETAARPNTTTPTLEPITFKHGEIYANPAITQTLLDDADFDISGWLAENVSDEFARQEGIAFLTGDGVNKPTGLLTYAVGAANEASHPGGAIATVPSGAAAALGSADSLIDFVYGLPQQYRQNAKWLMASGTAAIIAKMKDGDENYLWHETYVSGQPATLLGYPVEIDDNMPAVAAGTLPIAFGDFKRAYVINDRAGVRVLRDPYSAKPYVSFYTTKRVGGGLQDPNALRLMKIAAA